MLRILYQMLAVGALIALMAGSGSAMAEERSAPDLGAIDRYLEAQMGANHIPGLGLAITRGKDVLYLKGYGSAGSGRPMTPQTQFYVVHGAGGHATGRSWGDQA